MTTTTTKTMRLFLLPISTRRTLIYCERLQPTLAPGQKPPYLDRLLNKTSETWTKWESADKGWQKQVTNYGNQLFRRIPFEEWGLKTLPPLTKTREKEMIETGRLRFDVLFPRKFMRESAVLGTLERLATERQALHKNKLWQSVALMPVTIPFALVPVVPNLPFFYMCFRAYSHYRALYGGKLLARVLEGAGAGANAGKQALVRAVPEGRLDAMYAGGLVHATREAMRAAEPVSEEDVERVSGVVTRQTEGEGEEEVMVLKKWNGKLLAEEFGLPEMEVEIERAVEQVEKSIDEAKQRRQKAELEQSVGKKDEKKEV
jgi:hypothetical protein